MRKATKNMFPALHRHGALRKIELEKKSAMDDLIHAAVTAFSYAAGISVMNHALANPKARKVKK